ncbi:MAG: hypothetical protein HQ594_02330 [Candidatus Omnitrophica bacterium]|nr:hypothetical protein [Candidatus Omnitrophota bacterium]
MFNIPQHDINVPNIIIKFAKRILILKLSNLLIRQKKTAAYVTKIDILNNVLYEYKLNDISGKIQELDTYEGRYSL